MSLKSIKEGISRRLLPGFMLVSSIILLVIGVPRFLHELMLVPGTPILERINTGEIVPEEDLTLLEQSRLDALGFVDSPKAYFDLGTSYLTRTRLVTDEEKRLKYAQMSLDASMKGLKMAPLNTFAWLRVATAHTILGQNQYNKALEAWRNSVATARFEPFILIQRVHMGTILYRNMTPADIDLLKDQLSMTYHWDRHKLRQYARQNKLIEWTKFLGGPESEIAAFMMQ